ncbi:MAG TPA: hypothetical protein PLJ74_05300 [Myxococcota bacterium]|nr:hypothetical protein [Myxococcota bacterium]
MTKEEEHDVFLRLFFERARVAQHAYSEFFMEELPKSTDKEFEAWKVTIKKDKEAKHD